MYNLQKVLVMLSILQGEIYLNKGSLGDYTSCFLLSPPMF